MLHDDGAAPPPPLDLTGGRGGEGEHLVRVAHQRIQTGEEALLMLGGQLRVGQVVHGEHEQPGAGAHLPAEGLDGPGITGLEAEVHMDDVEALRVPADPPRVQHRRGAPGGGLIARRARIREDLLTAHGSRTAWM